MARSWGSTTAGKLFTGSPAWRLTLSDDRFQLSVEGKKHSGIVESLAGLAIKTGAMWATVQLPIDRGGRLVLDGIPNDDARVLRSAVTSSIERVEHQKEVTEKLRNFKATVAPIVAWSSQMVDATKVQLQTKGWLTRDFIQRQLDAKPQGFTTLLSDPAVLKHLESEATDIQGAVNLWKKDFREMADSINARHLSKQLADQKQFFDTVEKSPLTQEQAKAVVCFDNRLLLVASAGSGKTSTMVAKAGYALKNG